MHVQDNQSSGQSANTPGQDSASVAKNDALRRSKKRELDRRCQRMARERTKEKIAQLERIVADCQNKDQSGQLSSIMQQLHEVRKERDRLANNLRAIGRLASGTASQNDPSGSPDSGDHGSQDDSRNHIVTPSSYGSRGSVDFRRQVMYQHGYNADVASTRFSTPVSMVSQPMDNFFSYGNPPLVDLALMGEDNLQHQLQQSGPIVPAPHSNCECAHRQEPAPGQRPMNLWRFANEILSQRTKHQAEIARASDHCTDDVPIRAILEGWDAVEKHGALDPSWRMLRSIDQNLFANCPKTERLAIMRLMHRLLRFHSNPASEWGSRVPRWYLKRPSQSFAHSYAIDFLVWPGIRERFVFNQHNYCSNIFWELFSSNIHIQWPYEFRDCYTRHTDTGLFKVSPLFDEYIADITNWTMGPEMFQRFPEFYGDITPYNSVTALYHPPRQPSPAEHQARQMRAITDSENDDSTIQEMSQGGPTPIQEIPHSGAPMQEIDHHNARIQELPHHGTQRVSQVSHNGARIQEISHNGHFTGMELDLVGQIPYPQTSMGGKELDYPAIPMNYPGMENHMTYMIDQGIELL